MASPLAALARPEPLASSSQGRPFSSLSFSFLLLLLLRSFALLSMIQLLTYKGIQQGWAPVGAPRSYEEACRLRSLARRINGETRIYKLAVA
jgi:hypothetical protein